MTDETPNNVIPLRVIAGGRATKVSKPKRRKRNRTNREYPAGTPCTGYLFDEVLDRFEASLEWSGSDERMREAMQRLVAVVENAKGLADELMWSIEARAQENRRPPQ